MEEQEKRKKAIPFNQRIYWKIMDVASEYGYTLTYFDMSDQLNPILDFDGPDDEDKKLSFATEIHHILQSHGGVEAEPETIQ